MRTSLVLATVGLSLGATVVSFQSSQAGQPPGPDQQARLVGRSTLPASAVRAGSPPSGAFFSAQNLADATTNGVADQMAGAPYFLNQPVQGISAVVPAGNGTWWALADNGFGNRETSADWQLALYRLQPDFTAPNAAPPVLETVVLSDPGRKVPWKTVCDPTRGTDLPPLSFNILPATTPAACGTDPSARILTGFDFDPESIEVGADGTFWIGDEFGPFLLHADRTGRLLDAPVAYPGVKSPQNPTLDIAKEAPNVAQSRGFESLAISPDRRQLYAMFEGAVGDDDPQDVRIVTFDIQRRRFTSEVRKVRLEMPGAKVNLTTIFLTDKTTRAYPTAVAPVGTGGESAPELTALDADRFLMLERDGNGDGLDAPRFKKVFVIDTRHAGDHGGYVDKTPLVDLMAIPDPQKIGGDGDFFRFPFNTIESVHVVDDHTILVANDNNYPFSNGRARSKTPTRQGPFAPDDNELILIQVSTSLHPDPRLG